MKANKMHYFSHLFDKVRYMFRTTPLSIIRSTSTLYTCNRYLSCYFCWRLLAWSRSPATLSTFTRIQHDAEQCLPVKGTVQLFSNYSTVVKCAVNKGIDLKLNTSPSHRKFINNKGYCVLLPVYQVYHIRTLLWMSSFRIIYFRK
jgi:hypothetical protein